jgi:hypothetical protein
MATQSPGWYPDPNGSDSEVYWDGDRWHGRRQKRPTPTAAAPGGGQLGSPATSRPNVIPQTWVLAWGRLSTTAQALVITGIVFLVLMIGSWLSTKPWESQREKDCRAAMEAEGYKGSQLDEAIKFCVDSGK